MKRYAITILFALGLAMLAIPSSAQQENFINVHTNAPVAVPGTVLPAGNYVFRLIETETYPHVVEVIGSGGTPLGVYQVIPAVRLEPGNSRVVLTDPDAAGVQGISRWYFPGSMNGYQFVYSKKDIQKEDRIAQHLARQTNSGL